MAQGDPADPSVDGPATGQFWIPPGAKEIVPTPDIYLGDAPVSSESLDLCAKFEASPDSDRQNLYDCAVSEAKADGVVEPGSYSYEEMDRILQENGRLGDLGGAR